MEKWHWRNLKSIEDFLKHLLYQINREWLTFDQYFFVCAKYKKGLKNVFQRLHFQGSFSNAWEKYLETSYSHIQYNYRTKVIVSNATIVISFSMIDYQIQLFASFVPTRKLANSALDNTIYWYRLCRRYLKWYWIFNTDTMIKSYRNYICWNINWNTFN